MSAEHSTYHNQSIQTTSENALHIIDFFRSNFFDVTSVAPLDMEFPYMEIADKETLHLYDAGDNLAGTFKWRGALVGAHALKRAGYERLVIPSAGNHARGGMLSSKALSMPLDVIVPRTAPYSKREGLRDLSDDPRNRIHVYGNTFDESLEYAYRLANMQGSALLHPYDDDNVIRGQGTIVDDLLREKSDVDHIVLPLGGGGLLAGVLNRLHELGLSEILVTAVEAPGSNSLSKSMKAKKVSMAEAPNPAYGGSAVKFTSKRTLKSAMRYANLEVVTASPSDITYVMETYQQSRHDLMRTDSTFVPAFEPTSLVAVAGLYKTSRRNTSNTVVIGTGHNAPILFS